MTCGEKISRLRKSKGMTQEELGKVLNVTYQAVSKWERGESTPDFETMSLIAKFFQVPISHFEDGNDELLPEQPTEFEASVPAPVALGNMLGTCTVCGRLVKENEVAESSPKLVCKECAERNRQNAIAAAKRRHEEQKRKAERDVQEVLGHGFDVKLIISLVLAVACYVAFAVLVFMNRAADEEIGYGMMLFFVPLAVFGCVHTIGDSINELRDIDDDSEGYKLILSLIVGAGFALVNVVLFLVLHLTADSGEDFFYLIMIFLGAIVSFTFVSGMLWGSAVKTVFTAGGISFKLPGFIISLSLDSILLMIILKIFLSILAAVVFIVTTVIVALAAMFGSVFLFIPCLLWKIGKDAKAKKQLID